MNIKNSFNEFENKSKNQKISERFDGEFPRPNDLLQKSQSFLKLKALTSATIIILILVLIYILPLLYEVFDLYFPFRMNNNFKKTVGKKNGNIYPVSFDVLLNFINKIYFGIVNFLQKSKGRKCKLLV